MVFVRLNEEFRMDFLQFLYFFCNYLSVTPERKIRIYRRVTAQGSEKGGGDLLKQSNREFFLHTVHL